MEEKKPTGRPEKPIDWKLFEELCDLQCTQKEMAGVFKVDRSTLKDRVEAHYNEDFATVYEKLSEGGKASLRRTQAKLSKKHPGMAIFLGKQYLGQKDNDIALAIPPEIANQFQALMAQLSFRQIEQPAIDIPIEDHPQGPI